MRHCCICGREIIEPEPGILFVDCAGQPQELCGNCEMKVELLLNDRNGERRKSLADWFCRAAQNIADPEVKAYLMDLLKKTGHQTPEQRKADTLEASFSEERSGWVKALRTLTWMGTFLTIFTVLTLGIVLSENVDKTLGLLIAIVGTVLALISPIVTMIFLDAADDLRRIRVYLEKK